MKRLFIISAAMLLFSTPLPAATWHITPDGTGDAPTIQAGIDSAAAGDTVLVACGTYYEHDLVMKSKVCLRGEADFPPCVTIDAQHQGKLINCTTITLTLIEGITFTNGSQGGVGIYGWVTMRNCVFANNANPTVETSFTPPEFHNCVFSGNYSQGPWPMATITCVYAGSSPLFKNCTFVDNYAGIAAGMDAFPRIENSIIAHCQEYSLLCGEMSGFFISCSDLYANGGAKDDSAIVDYNPSCFMADPQFCGIPGSHNNYLQSDSPCAPGNHPDGYDCGLIGALPVLCGITPIEKKSWGGIKALYKE